MPQNLERSMEIFENFQREDEEYKNKVDNLIKELKVFNKEFIDRYLNLYVDNKYICKNFYKWLTREWHKFEIVQRYESNSSFYDILEFPYNIFYEYICLAEDYYADREIYLKQLIKIDDIKNSTENLIIFLAEDKNNISKTGEIINILLEPLKHAKKGFRMEIPKEQQAKIVRKNLNYYLNYLKNNKLCEFFSIGLSILKGSPGYDYINQLKNNIPDKCSYNKLLTLGDLYNESAKILNIFSELRTKFPNIVNEKFESLEEEVKSRLLNLKYEIKINPDKYLKMKYFIGIFYDWRY